jgi:hypothetical protein
VRKIRIDLGVSIEFPCLPIYSREKAEEKKKSGAYWAVAKIRYSSVDRVQKADGTFGRAPDGLLIYIKPAVYGNEPRDVLEYKESNPAFPHQSTGDQFFDEPQFESYRSLGSFVMDRLCGGRDDKDDLDLIRVARMAYEQLEGHCVEEFKVGDFNKWIEDWLTRTQ